MSTRKTRSAMVERSVSIKSAKVKSNVNENMNKDMIKAKRKTKKIQREESSFDIKNNLEISAKQIVRKESSDTNKLFNKSIKKRAVNQRLYIDKTAKTKDKSISQEDQSIDSKGTNRTLRGTYNSIIHTTELIKNDLSQLNSLENLDSDKTPNKQRKWKATVTNVKVSPIMVTPKSISLKLDLTPHRSKKTPKKSPISLGSPKTHSKTASKLFKTPRKLSPDISKEDLDEFFNDTPNKKSRKMKKDNLNNICISNKSLSTSSVVKSKRRKPNLRNFSKSPQIILRSSKSKKSKSSKLKLPALSQAKKRSLEMSSSDAIPDLDTAKSLRINIKKSPLLKKKNLSTIKERLLHSRLKKVLMNSQVKDLLAEPIVLLKKLSPKSIQKIPTVTKTQSDTLIKVGSPLISAENSSKVLMSRNSAKSDASINKNFNAKLRNNSMSTPVNRISARIQHNATSQKNDKLFISLMSSTPRENMPLMNINLASNISLHTKSKHKNRSNTQLSSTMNNSTVNENLSESSLFNTSLYINNVNQSYLSNVTKKNTTYGKDAVTLLEKEQENKKDGTYELEGPLSFRSLCQGPLTQDLQQMIKKRTSTDANLNIREDVKRFKVHFANITPGSTHKSINKPTRLLSNISHNVNVQKRSIMNSAHKSRKMETSKFTQNLVATSSKTKLNPFANRATLKIQLNKIRVTPETFPLMEKKSEKKSSVKKVPNFQKIHKQLFAKSESLLDANKRLRNRHLAFTMNKAIMSPKEDVKKKQNKPLPTETRNGIHNRFGFKLRKAEATHVILKKQAVFSRKTKQHETRMMLKGVRTNRRFELQMKTRNLNA